MADESTTSMPRRRRLHNTLDPPDEETQKFLPRRRRLHNTLDPPDEQTQKFLPRRRRSRERTRKLYTDDWTIGDEELEGRRTFQLDEKIECERYNLDNFSGLFKEMTGAELSLLYLQRHGLVIPLLFRDKAGLGLRVPSSNFTVNDVRTCVGSKRIVDVMDVNTQKNEDMSMKEWQRYYEDVSKERLLNVISLEFSHTKLENYVQSPSVVRQVDWVDVVWPRHLKEAQVESTNLLEDMMYPKVQKYCLMSVKGCYTDFHVDFGGTSVWYHILRGGKIFWLIPPTEKNLALYQEWVLSGKQSDVFFGDMVDRCGRINLNAGMTLFIPTGWIHAVYTPQDSLVFGGNFLHSFGIEKQLKVAQVEEQTKVPQKFRYPFFTEMLWYVLERYVHVLLGRSHLEIPESQRHHSIPINTDPNTHLHLTPFELHGLKSIVMYLHSLPSTKKNVPDLIRDPVALIHDVRCLVEQHRHDNPDAAITGIPILPSPPPMTIADRERMRITKKSFTAKSQPGTPNEKTETKSSFPRRRRTRCKKCEACTRTDCTECAYCQDMVKFGGTGRAKQTCLMRQCLRPMLPVTAACKVCRLDGWGQQPSSLMGKPTPGTASSLMECSVCFDIAHPECVGVDSQGIAVSEDVPNSWECPVCCETGRNLDGRSRQGKARARKVSVSSAASSTPTTDSERATTPSKRPRPDPSETWNEREPAEGEHRTAMRSQLAIQLTGSSSKVLKRPHVVVRPAQLPLFHRPDNSVQSYSLDKSVILAVFRFLNRRDLARCALVCRSWAQCSIDPSLWRNLDMSHAHLTASHLTGIARRQPESLCLDWSDVTKRQLAWLLGRLSQLRSLSLQGCAWSNVCVLRSCICPPLINLNLSYVSGLNDFSLREMLSPPSDSRPGLIDKTSRLKYLKSLSLAGCEITDVALRYVAQHLPHVESLDLSSCGRLTDAGVAQLTTSSAHALNNLVSLNLANCRLLTETSLDHLVRCKALKRLDLRHTTTQVSTQGVIKFAARSIHNLHVTDVKLVQEKKIKDTKLT